MELDIPSEKYKESFIAAVKEYQEEVPRNSRHDSYRGLSLRELRSDFSSYIKRIEDASKGIGLPQDYVPQTDYWLVEGNEFIGRISIRHHLNDHLLSLGGHIGYDIRPSKRTLGYGYKILELALPKAKELGIERVLLTSDETNIPSRKIIEANGGIFEDKRANPHGGSDKRRYWIDI